MYILKYRATIEEKKHFETIYQGNKDRVYIEYVLGVEC